ncbi:MAG: hypothetical protein ACP5US_03445 [Candidatus Kryptoniota bacterium]
MEFKLIIHRRKWELLIANSLIFFILNPSLLLAQNFSISAGLGLSYYTTPSLVHYLNFLGATSSTSGSFTSAGEFFGRGDCLIASDWTVGVELAYLSQNYTTGYGGQVSYSYTMPTVTIHKLFYGDGFFLRYGGGIGYHFGSLSVPVLPGGTADYFSKGMGIKADMSLDTKLGTSLYALIGFQIRGEFLGNLKDSSGQQLRYTDNYGIHPTNMYLSGIGVLLGLSYYF